MVDLRDGVATAVGLLREACWLGTAGLLPDADGGRITPAWLTRALAPRFPGVRVGTVDPVGSDSGTTDRVRLRVTYDDAGAGARPPAAVFVKRPPARRGTRLFVNLLRLGATEARFYRDVAS